MTRKIKIFLQDITFPNAKKVRENTLTVLGVSAAMAVYVSLLDFASMNVVAMLLSLFQTT